MFSVPSACLQVGLGRGRRPVSIVILPPPDWLQAGTLLAFSKMIKPDSRAALWKCTSVWFVLPPDSPSFCYPTKIHNRNFFCKRFILENKTNKPCCCDDSCESVETAANHFFGFTYCRNLQAPFCENSGKLKLLPLFPAIFRGFIHSLQQIPSIFFNSSPQDLMERLWREQD